MRVHHLNCGTLRPLGGRRINGGRPPWRSARLVCHCLLVESDAGLVLVDTGFGLQAIEERRRSLPRWLLAPQGLGPDESRGLQRTRHAYTLLLTRAALDPEETAARQIARLGHAPADVRHIVLTHMDGDHVSGLSDFPNAKVHVHDVEHRAAMDPPTKAERLRYWQGHWNHGPDWVTYTAGEGDGWLGFDAVRELDGLPDIALVPLRGHTRGHAGVAVRAAGDGWLLHAGDAYFFAGEADPVAPHSTPGLAGFQKRLAVDGDARRRNQERLRELRRDHGDEVEMFCSHDPDEFERCRSRRPSSRR
jgi:glyoxylase-like metal-dependent hydrolase (beta-lactamase superfamily II)